MSTSRATWPSPSLSNNGRTKRPSPAVLEPWSGDPPPPQPALGQVGGLLDLGIPGCECLQVLVELSSDFFATAPTPAPHVGRVEFLRPPEVRTRWRATVTTFGPWIKVPVTLFLVFYQLVRIVQAVQGGHFAGGPPLAWELIEVVFYYAVVGLIMKAMWASGKPDSGRLGR